MSDIDFESVDENFPVQGQDNDTQVFRDNFFFIKNGLRVSKEEIEDLQNNTARTDQDTDFNGVAIENAVLSKNSLRAWNYGTRSQTVTVDFKNGHYQILTLDAAQIQLEFENFPNQPFTQFNEEFGEDDINPRGVVGKIWLELRIAPNSTPCQLVFSTSGSGATVFKTNFNIPLTITEDPIIFEIWRYSQNEIFIRLIGVFT
jgi:hypothetical protein